MSLPLTRRQINTLADALAPEGRKTLASRSRYRLLLGGEDFSHLLKSHSYEAGDGPAMILTATIAATLPGTLEHESATLEQLIEGESFRVFTGEVVIVDADSERGYTVVSCASTSTHLDGTPLPDTLTSFVQSESRTALYEVLSVLLRPGGYAGLDISQPTEAIFDRSGEDEYSWTDHLSDVAEAIREDTGLTFFDDGHNVARGYLEESLTRAGEPLMELVAGADLVDYSHATLYMQKYSKVRVYRARTDGTNELLASANTGVRAVGDKPLDIEVSDPDALKAGDRAFREALAIQADHREASFDLLYPIPHLTRTDTLGVTESIKGFHKGRAGTWIRRHLFRVTGFSGDESKRMSVSGVQREVSAEFVVTPERVPVERASGVARGPFGTDYLGDPYFSDSLAWVSLDADGDPIFNVEGAEADGVYIFAHPTDANVVVVSMRPLSEFVTTP